MSHDPYAVEGLFQNEEVLDDEQLINRQAGKSNTTRGWTLMGVTGMNWSDGDHAIRVLPPKPQYLQRGQKEFYVLSLYHRVEIADDSSDTGRRHIEVLSQKNFNGSRCLDYFDLHRKRIMFSLPDKASRRAFFQNQDNEWLNEKTKAYFFFLKAQLDEHNGVYHEPSDLRVASAPKTVRTECDKIPVHPRKPILFYHPEKGTPIYLSRYQDGSDKRNKKYAVDHENFPCPIFSDPPSIYRFLEKVPDIKHYLTMKHQLGSPHSKTDCRVFSPTQIEDMKAGEKTLEECVEENIAKYSKGEKILSRREFDWMKEFDDRLWAKKNDPFPLIDYGKESVPVPREYSPEADYTPEQVMSQGYTPTHHYDDTPAPQKAPTLPSRQRRGGRSLPAQTPPPPAPPLDDDVPF